MQEVQVNELSENQKKCLDFITEFTVRNLRHPSQIEIFKSMGLQYRGTVHAIVKALIEKGYLKEGRTGRSYELPVQVVRSQTIRLQLGEAVNIGPIYIGIFCIERTRQEVSIEVIAPKVMGDLKPDK